MRHFLFEEEEYRIKPSFRRNRNEGDSARALARLLRRGGKRRRSPSGGGRGGVLRRIDARQKCVAKAQYSTSRAAHRLQLEHYLVREGAGRDGESPALYGTDIDEYKEHMTDKNFRIFLSPQSNKIDLTRLTETFVKKLELQTGYRLYWQAANHYNTAHPHAHLLINGVDKNGKEVTFPRDVVKTFMREAARDLCTFQIGSRSNEDLAVEREKELAASRWTKLDERLKELAGGGFRVNLAGTSGTDRDRFLLRLENLRKMKLCAFKDGGYKLSPKWEGDLKANGHYNAFLKARDALKYTSPSRLKVYSGEGGRVTGKVTKVFRVDEEASDNHAVLLEGLDGKAYFVPLFRRPEIKEKDRKTALKEGEFITLSAYRNQRGRLTPVMYRKEGWSLRKEIRKEGYNGKLAQAVAGGKELRREQEAKRA